MSDHPGRDDRRLARLIWQAGLGAADPEAALGKALAGADWSVPAGGRLVLLAVGKAAPAMLAAARFHAREQGLRPESWCITTRENAALARRAAPDRLFLAGHPLPDEAGLEAARAVRALAQELGKGDRLVALVSGGASALLPAPVAGLALADKIAATRLLLAHGFTIDEINRIRQALSQLKGGRLARLAAPARVESWLLSDVIGDDPAVIGSGPTAWAAASAVQVRALLEEKGVWMELPAAVRAILARRSAVDDPPLTLPGNAAPPVIIGSNALSRAAMAEEAVRHFDGGNVRSLEEPLTGDVTEEARRLVREVAALPDEGPAVLLAGGEPVVTLRGSGKGGRNQELALRFSSEAEKAGLGGRWAFLAAGTDGRDGPTEAAGGLVDEGTLDRIRARGLSPEALLEENDSHRALAAAGDLFVTGPTGTNVADLHVFVCLPGEASRGA